MSQPVNRNLSSHRPSLPVNPKVKPSSKASAVQQLKPFEPAGLSRTAKLTKLSIPSSATAHETSLSRSTEVSHVTKKPVGRPPVIPVTAKPSIVLPRQRPSVIAAFHHAVAVKLDSDGTRKNPRSLQTSSSDSWRTWPNPTRTVAVPPQCRRATSCDSSDSSDLSLATSDSGEQSSNLNLVSQENFLTWLVSRTITVSLDEKVSSRSWKVDRLALKRISPEKCTVRDLRLGLEYVTGIPAHLTYLRFATEEMQDNHSLEKAALNGGRATLCVYSVWQDFIAILFTGNFKDITTAISLQDPNTAPVCSDVFSVMIAHDGETRRALSVSDVLRRAPSDLDAAHHAQLLQTTVHGQKELKMPVYTVTKENNLVTTRMREDMMNERRYVALLFALVHKHIPLLRWILSEPTHDLNYRYQSGRNLVFFATCFRNIAFLTELLAAKVDWQAPDATGLTPAQLASRTADEKVIVVYQELESALDGGDGKKKSRGKPACNKTDKSVKNV